MLVDRKDFGDDKLKSIEEAEVKKKILVGFVDPGSVFLWSPTKACRGQ